ncbi:hypothetical protein DFH08DRAFT_210627 [Mycena albidolilacea]|uniref:TEA domain-containing protein n=1 Tax=Mycena albidolilacea TaxID=1033008 RepID=A0AAD6ZYK1_9AGAR|nr:hypothetical protein DFH08DRAFT_210627 [Mycena albidolilacea]
MAARWQALVQLCRRNNIPHRLKRPHRRCSFRVTVYKAGTLTWRLDPMYSPAVPSAEFFPPCSELPPSPLNKMAWLEPTPQSQVISDTLQAVLRGRKTWKSRGGEPIWPLDLEAALLEALEKYRPEDCRETLILGRFPGRNRFISDYICDKTGKRRSPKQVGSRLQQLRDCCEDTRLRRLICPFPKPPPWSASSVATNSATSSIVPSPEEWFHPDTLSPRNTIIYIDILPEGQHERSVRGIISPPWPDVEDSTVIHASNRPRRLKSISPTVSFAAPSPLIAHSRFTVRTGDMVLHTETAPLVLVVDRALQPPVFLYSTQLVPKFWNIIVDDPGASQLKMSFSCLSKLTSRIRYHQIHDFPRRCSDRKLVSPLFGDV